MANSKQKVQKVSKVDSLGALREIKTAGRPSHDLKIREFKDLDNPGNKAADCCNSLYSFKYDAEAAAKAAAPALADIDKKYQALEDSVSAELRSLREKSGKIVLKVDSIAKIPADQLESSRSKSIAEGEGVVSLAKEIADHVLNLKKIEVEHALAKEEALAVSASQAMEKDEAEFFPIYRRQKALLPLLAEVEKAVEEASKIVSLAIEDKNKLEAAYAARLTKEQQGEAHSALLGKKVQNQCELFAIDNLKPFLFYRERAAAAKEIAQTLIFLGKDNKSLTKKIRLSHEDAAQAIYAEQKEAPTSAAAELIYQERAAAINAVREAEKTQIAEKLKGAKSLAAEWKKLQLDDKAAIADEKIDELRLKAQELSSARQAAEKKELQQHSRETEEKIAGMAAVVREPKELAEFSTEVEKAQKLSLNIKDYKETRPTLALLKSLNHRLKKDELELNKSCKKASKAQVQLAKKAVDKADEIRHIKREEKDQCSALASEIDKLILSKIEDTSAKEKYPLYSAAKQRLDSLLIERSSCESHYSDSQKLCQLSYTKLMERVKQKYDEKLADIYRRMDIDRIGIAMGRTLEHEKLINKRYAHLARLQNKTKLIQNSYNDALASALVIYKQDTAEAEHAYKVAADKLDRQIVLEKNTIAGGRRYAELTDQLTAKDQLSAAKSKSKLSVEKGLCDIAQQEAERFKLSWAAKSSEAAAAKNLRRQTLINHEYLCDAEAIKVRRFSLKYTPKKIFIRVFVIVVVSLTLGLIKFIFPDPLIGFIIGALLALAIELLIYFLSPICYIFPKNGGLIIYTSQGEQMFELTDGDIVNELMFTKRRWLRRLPALMGYQVLVESGADVFRFSIKGKEYKRILLELSDRVAAENKSSAEADQRLMKEEAKKIRHESSTNEASFIA